ncbi:tetratricopeptide repeat protein [Candidatus Acetothermia bacterium]|nr:tetratricopeptide repeat protein [Candidatus Acetothermia bacterium]
MSLYDLGYTDFFDPHWNYESAKVLFEECLALCREVGNRSLLAWALWQLGGRATRFEGDYRRATALYEESLALFRELKYKWGVAGSLWGLGDVALRQADYKRAAALLEESLALCREMGTFYIGSLLHSLGEVALYQRNFERAKNFFEEGLAWHRERADKRGIAWSLEELGLMARYQGHYEQAKALFKESLALSRETGNIDIAWALGGMGLVAQDQGDYPRAQALHKERLALLQRQGYKLAIVDCVERLAQVACVQGQLERAARLFGAATAVRETIGAPVPPCDHEDYERDIAAVRAGLGDTKFAKAWEGGRAMTLEQAIKFALEYLLRR